MENLKDKSPEEQERIAKVLAERQEARNEKLKLDEHLRRFHIYVLDLMRDPVKCAGG